MPGKGNARDLETLWVCKTPCRFDYFIKHSFPTTTTGGKQDLTEQIICMGQRQHFGPQSLHFRGVKQPQHYAYMGASHRHRTMMWGRDETREQLHHTTCCLVPLRACCQQQLALKTSTATFSSFSTPCSLESMQPVSPSPRLSHTPGGKQLSAQQEPEGDASGSQVLTSPLSIALWQQPKAYGTIAHNKSFYQIKYWQSCKSFSSE